MSFVLDALTKADRERDDSHNHKNAVETNDFLSSEIHPSNDKVNNKIKYYLFLVFVVTLLSVWVYLTLMSDRPAVTELVVLDDAKQIAIESPPTFNKPVETTLEIPQHEATLAKPDYNVTGHIYLSDSHPANKIFVDEISYRIGSQLPDGYEIVSITPKTLIVEKYEQYFVIDY